MRDLTSGLLDDSYKINYSLTELDKLQELFNQIYRYFLIYEDNNRNFGNLSNPRSENKMISHLQKVDIKLKSITTIDNTLIKDILHNYQEEIIEEIYPLIKKNAKKLSFYYKCFFGNLLLSILILIICFIYSSVKVDTILEIEEILNIRLITFIVSSFIFIIIDILINVFSFIRQDLIVDEFLNNS